MEAVFSSIGLGSYPRKSDTHHEEIIKYSATALVQVQLYNSQIFGTMPGLSMTDLH